MQLRVIGALLPVKNVPMVKEALCRKYQAIFEKTKSLIRMKVITRTTGTPSATDVQVEDVWDILESDSESKEIVVRHSFRIFFFSRPFFIASKMETAMTESQIQNF